MRTINIEQLKEILLMEKVHFMYRKRDGTLREAYGTLQYAFIPENMIPKKNLRKSISFRYYDLEKGAWRSISKEVTEVDALSQ